MFILSITKNKKKYSIPKCYFTFISFLSIKLLTCKKCTGVNSYYPHFASKKSPSRQDDEMVGRHFNSSLPDATNRET